MTHARSEVLSTTLIIVAGTAVAAIIGWQAIVGFILGGTAVVLVAVLCDMDFE
jgi:hypothetical protein